MSVADFQAEMSAKGTQEEDIATIEAALSICGVVLTQVTPASQGMPTWLGAKGNCLVAMLLDLSSHHATVMVMAAEDVPNTEEFLSWLLLRPTPPVCRFKVEPEIRNGREILDVSCVGMLMGKVELETMSELIQAVYDTASNAADVIVDRFGGHLYVGRDR
jgi:hypothetical protein